MKEKEEARLMLLKEQEDELRKKGFLRCLKLGSWKVTEESLDNFLKNYDGKDIDNIEEVNK